MGAIRDPKDAKQNQGRARAQEFAGRLFEFEEDLPGEQGEQVQFRYSVMDFIKVDEDFDTESGNIVERHKQSDHANSSYVKKLQIFSDFASEHGFLDGDVWLSFQDKPLRFISQELSPATTAKDGSAISAGYSYVPVEVLEETEAPEPDAKVMAAIEGALEDGEQTVAQLTRAVNKKEPLRAKLEASGGIRTVLAFMEEAGSVTKDGNVYTIV